MNARNRCVVVLVGALLALMFISQGRLVSCAEALPLAGAEPRGLFYELVPLCMLAITVLALAKLLRRFW